MEDSYTVLEAGRRLKIVKDLLAEAKKETSEIQKEYDVLRKKIMPELMDEQGVQSINIRDVGRISLKAEVYASIVPEQKRIALTWLEDNGFADVIKPDVNSSTLKALIKECLGDGTELPEELFTITPYMMAVLTKN